MINMPWANDGDIGNN